eukprot:TRINITY_DN11780_c0_g1_i2.p1 TRINITY_DN11780_c0_g1~~TRINITY_DN11780_c0_g1_i2.p1  ORF type:complete len:204 (-),score=42.30 TRINITY_DN11780_c0_g1_i2:15-626(-)
MSGSSSVQLDKHPFLEWKFNDMQKTAKKHNLKSGRKTRSEVRLMLMEHFGLDTDPDAYGPFVDHNDDSSWSREDIRLELERLGHHESAKVLQRTSLSQLMNQCKQAIKEHSASASSASAKRKKRPKSSKSSSKKLRRRTPPPSDSDSDDSSDESDQELGSKSTRSTRSTRAKNPRKKSKKGAKVSWHRTFGPFSTPILTISLH